ncbi:NAD-binding protein [Calocera viscosa TUFC12733]|uniref:NAD-binding protein n=1 Tax=Calocera viscosa (strain TUFC12733) TaxID=1330018 RepID=A0A167IM79_CALVF|nr:NAD-binding protein [Calocera viscosa TUFC12733]
MGQVLRVLSTGSEIWPPQAKFLPENMPDLSEKVAIITGGNAGIGFVACKYLLLKGATVYLACRSQKKADEAIAKLRQLTGSDKVYFVQCDLANLPAVKKCAEDFLSKESHLHMLFNSAGVMVCPVDQVTKQGYDMQFGTNVIGHAYLTMLLTPTLIATAKDCPEGNVRVVTTSSNLHLGAPTGGFDYGTLKDSDYRTRKLTPMIAYSQSKWGNVLLANEIARRYGQYGVVSTSLNPGLIRTELFRYAEGIGAWAAVLDPLGAVTMLYAGTSPEVASQNGGYFVPWARRSSARSDTRDDAAGKRLWEYIEREVKSMSL